MSLDSILANLAKVQKRMRMAQPMTNAPMTRIEDTVAAALTALTAAGVYPDVIKLLVEGDPMHGVEPNALSKAVRAVVEHERARILRVLADSGLGREPINFGTLEVMHEQLEKARTKS